MSGKLEMFNYIDEYHKMTCWVNYRLPRPMYTRATFQEWHSGNHRPSNVAAKRLSLAALIGCTKRRVLFYKVRRLTKIVMSSMVGMFESQWIQLIQLFILFYL